MSLLICIKDRSEFGRVGLQGIHQILESSNDVENVLYNADRDGFDRAFVYVHGWDEGSFDEGEIGELIREFCERGATVGSIQRTMTDLTSSICEALTWDQYQRVTTSSDRQYSTFFQRALKASRRRSIQTMAIKGLKYCYVMGWNGGAA